jgi:hypothetical protein
VIHHLEDAFDLGRKFRHVVEDVRNERVAGQTAGLRLEGGEQAMTQGRLESPGQVLGDDVVAARAQR